MVIHRDGFFPVAIGKTVSVALRRACPLPMKSKSAMDCLQVGHGNDGAVTGHVVSGSSRRDGSSFALVIFMRTA